MKKIISGGRLGLGLGLTLVLSFKSFAIDILSESNLSLKIATEKNVEAQYNYFFNDDPLLYYLKGYASNNGLKIVVSEEVNPKLTKSLIRGRFFAKGSTDLLNALAEQYGFNWFIYSGTLYITSLKQITTNVEVSAENMSDIKAHLSQIGLLDARFAYSELVSQNKVVISGPKEYINLARKEITSLNVNLANEQIAIFHLKYANATDLKFTFNNQQIVVPGVASLLRSIFASKSMALPHARLTSDVVDLAKSSNSNISGNGNNESGANSSTISKDDETNSNSFASNIQADSRLNTIIIRDKSSNLGLYKNLINSLDVPAPLIQIEVMVIHVDQDKLSQQGINWWGSTPNALSGGFGAANLNSGPTNNLSASYGQINPGQLIVTNIASFAASLQFLEANNSAQTEARPSLATIDNIPAIMTLTNNIFNNKMGNPNGGSANNSISYNGVQLTQSLQITPHLIMDHENKNQIKLTMILQDGAVDELSSKVMPNYSQGYLNSQAVIKEGQSIILAGYTKNNVVTEVYKVPLLGDIPLLGWLFKTATSVNHKITTLYLVTPRIIWQDKMIKLKDHIIISGNSYSPESSNYQIVTDNKPQDNSHTTPTNVTSTNANANIAIESEQMINPYSNSPLNQTTLKQSRLLIEPTKH